MIDATSYASRDEARPRGLPPEMDGAGGEEMIITARGEPALEVINADKSVSPAQGDLEDEAPAF